jgi:CBS domain-containing protein
LTWINLLWPQMGIINKKGAFLMASIAADIMTSPAVVVAPTASVAEIATLLSNKHISAVPVCNPDNSLVGIISEKDILRPFCESARVKRDWWLGLLASGTELSQQFLDYIRQDTRTAADLMIRHVITADDQATLPQLAELMVKNGIKRIPIIRDDKVAGIVSRADLVSALARAPAMLV